VLIRMRSNPLTLPSSGSAYGPPLKSNYKGFPKSQASDGHDPRNAGRKQQEISSSWRRCEEGGNARCGLAQLQADIEAAASALQTLMQDARGGLNR
jgi:hypothetical protein